MELFQFDEVVTNDIDDSGVDMTSYDVRLLFHFSFDHGKQR